MTTSGATPPEGSTTAHGDALDPEQHRRVEQAAARSTAAGIRSVPHFVFGERVAINGGRSEDEIASAIRQAAAAAAPFG